MTKLNATTPLAAPKSDAPLSAAEDATFFVVSTVLDSVSTSD